jgi:pilus assembly protein Flp/PilA
MLNKLFSIKSQKGVTMIEYALIAALVAVGVIVALGPLRDAIIALFNQVSVALNNAAG